MQAVMRRVIDVLGAAVGVILLTPVMALIALLVKIDSAGPVIFRQMRVGKGGELFEFYKFRTMRVESDPYGFSPREETDPRVTRIGRFLRRSSLDELPQLFNVLQGDMSLVGPRPLLPWQYEKWTAHQRRRCEVKPGMTGWAQTHGRAGLTHEDKIELDIWYVDHASLILDFKIILQTIVQTIKGKDVLEVQYSRETFPEEGPR